MNDPLDPLSSEARRREQILSAHKPLDPQSSEARRREQILSARSEVPAKPGMPGFLKVLLIVVIGIPLGLIALVGLVFGICLMGAR